MYFIRISTPLVSRPLMAWSISLGFVAFSTFITNWNALSWQWKQKQSHTQVKALWTYMIENNQCGLPVPGGMYSLWWTIRGFSAQMGYLFELQVCERGPFFRLEVCERGTFSRKGMWKGYLLGERYVKWCWFSKFSMWKGANFQNLVWERVLIFPNLVCERVRGPDLRWCIPVWNRSKYPRPPCSLCAPCQCTCSSTIS